MRPSSLPRPGRSGPAVTVQLALAQSKAAIQKLNDLWAEAYNKGDAKAVAAMYASDAYMAPMIKGTAAIEAYLREAVKSHGDLNCTTIYVKPLGPRAARENRRAACMGRISAAHPGRRSRDGPSVAPRCASVGYRITTRKDGPA